jgi:ankyrin repeat protein
MSAGDWKSLYQAAVEGDLALVTHHLADGVNPNYQHPEILRTPLVASLIEGHLAVASYLLAKGADPALVSELDNLSPLQAAQRHGHLEFAARLKEMGVKDRKTPFWWRWLPI